VEKQDGRSDNSTSRLQEVGIETKNDNIESTEEKYDQ
jgi:hypothetical protein